MNNNFSDKVKKAVDRLKAFEPEDGYHLAYSGGKDSDCIKILAELAGVKFEAVHRLTSADAPETVNYVKSQKDVKIEKPRYNSGEQITMWNLIPLRGFPPLRMLRYCCSELKEDGGKGKIVITGVRWSESSKRKANGGLVKIIGKPKGTQKMAEEFGADYAITKQGSLILANDNDESRLMVEHCYRTRQTVVNPIIDWNDEEVWEFLKYYGCESNPLYKDAGYKRIGCIGCPMARKSAREEHFERYPKYKENYIRAFDRMIKKRKNEGKKVDEHWTTGEEVFEWWLKS